MLRTHFCGNCAFLDRVLGRCNKYRTPLPVNIELKFLRCILCEENNKGGP